MKYDYYGNYENNTTDDLFTFSVNEIHKKQKDRETNRIQIYKKIASKCFKKIKETSQSEQTYCFFEIPEYLPGLPLYNMTECVMFILNLLKEKGFKSRYCDGYKIFISWNLPKPNLKLIENNPQEHFNNKSKSIIDELNLKYKPIENATPFSQFIPRKTS